MDNKDGFKTTLYPSLELDEGMLNLINKGYNNIVYLKGKLKSFYISEVQKINKGNFETLNIILDFRNSHVREKILNQIQKTSVYILYGDELVREIENPCLNKKRTITREVVCLYIHGCKFCPGIYYIKEENGSIVTPSYN